MKLSHNLKRCSEVKIIEARKDDNVEKIRLTSFLEMVKSNWKCVVTHQALRSIADKKYNKLDYLPLAEDVKILNKHLTTKINESMEELKNGIVENGMLASATLA